MADYEIKRRIKTYNVNYKCLH